MFWTLTIDLSKIKGQGDVIKVSYYVSGITTAYRFLFPQRNLKENGLWFYNVFSEIIFIICEFLIHYSSFSNRCNICLVFSNFCFSIWIFFPLHFSRAVNISKMADTNQQSPPPQLGPVVCDVFVCLGYFILSTFNNLAWYYLPCSVYQIYVKRHFILYVNNIGMPGPLLKKCASTFMKTFQRRCHFAIPAT